MFEKDDIVYADDPTPLIKVKTVYAYDDYSLILNFSNGEVKKFNANNLIKSGVFAKLSDINLFKQVHVDYGTVVWNEDLDICPNYLYQNSI